MFHQLDTPALDTENAVHINELVKNETGNSTANTDKLTSRLKDVFADYMLIVFHFVLEGVVKMIVASGGLLKW